MGATVELWSFQPLTRLAELEAHGELVGSWEHVPPSTGDAIARGYRAMTATMERAGVPTGGRPPVWAWGGRPVTVADAESLVGESLRHGWATIEFTAPAALAMATDYGAWNDYLAELFGTTGVVPTAWDVPTPIGRELVQVCLPVLRAEWVRQVHPLPRSAPD
ncbi:hypothetical protein [Pseudonocardia sp. MH-G8]|uniref:hypothetical protein n=1 Tax=Pseudonocardia sp. MH-G8 TaxID=1854588 RepID=UPI000B9FF57E|nr:hypothetical protein [Pseudonocardia sp. MH-G8]OZM83817.1 hypothetical protein CFP66_04975 [Pseudonocardia sp. MH-G8]